MNKCLQLAILGISVLGYSQQLSNSGFESWTSHPSGEEVPAAPWEVSLEYVPGEYIVTGSKTTDMHSGNFAVLLNPYNADDVSNVKLLETQNTFTPFSAKPYTLEGYYKFSPASDDKIVVLAEVANGLSVIGSGEMTIDDATSTYTHFIFSIKYTNNVLAPDAIRIKFSMADNQATLGTTFTLDDLALGYTIMSTWEETYTTQGLEVNNNLVGFLDRDLKANFEVLDMMGNTLKNAANTNQISFEELTAGTYVVRILSEDGKSQVVKVMH